MVSRGSDYLSLLSKISRLRWYPGGNGPRCKSEPDPGKKVRSASSPPYISRCLLSPAIGGTTMDTVNVGPSGLVTILMGCTKKICKDG